MGKGSVTTAGGFPVHDITHHSKRTQQENIRSAIEADREGDSQEIEKNIDIDWGTIHSYLTKKSKSIPAILTVERAIQFFEDNAVDEYESFYKFVARLLRESMNRKPILHTEGEDLNDEQK